MYADLLWLSKIYHYIPVHYQYLYIPGYTIYKLIILYCYFCVLFLHDVRVSSSHYRWYCWTSELWGWHFFGDMVAWCCLEPDGCHPSLCPSWVEMEYGMIWVSSWVLSTDTWHMLLQLFDLTQTLMKHNKDCRIIIAVLLYSFLTILILAEFHIHGSGLFITLSRNLRNFPMALQSQSKAFPAQYANWNHVCQPLEALCPSLPILCLSVLFFPQHCPW